MTMHPRSNFLGLIINVRNNIMEKTQPRKNLEKPIFRYWTPNWYDVNAAYPKNESFITFVDDATLGVGDTLYRLAFLAPEDLSNNRLYILEPRTYNLLQDLYKIKGISFPNIFRKSFISHQKFKNLLIAKSPISKLARVLFNLYVSILNNPRSLSSLIVEDGIASRSYNLSLFKGISSQSIDIRNPQLFFTFTCARKDSCLFAHHLNKAVATIPSLKLIQHFSSEAEKLYYLDVLPADKIDSGYFGRSIDDQINLIISSDIIITVASSIAKFAIVLDKALLLILFPTHNSGFTQYYEYKQPIYETSKYFIYLVSAKFFILKYKFPNSELSEVTFSDSLQLALSFFKTNSV